MNPITNDQGMNCVHASEKESHPAAKLFPLMDGQDLADFVEDVKKNGLLNPIVLHEGMILDGRNRQLACTMEGVAPRYVEWNHDGISPTEWVLSINLQRRQLTTTRINQAKRKQQNHEDSDALPDL